MTRHSPLSTIRLPLRLSRHWLIFFLGALLFILMVSSQIGRRQNPNPHPVAFLAADGIPQVVLEHNQLDQYVTTGRINGEAIQFLVDTGSADVAMPFMVAQRLNLRLRPGGLSKTGNGTIASWTTRLDSVDVGGLTVRNVKATVLPNMQGDEVLLGMSYLKHMEVVLGGGRLALRPYVAAD